MPASEFSDVFVSYRRLDVEFVQRLVGDLQKEGKEVWIDWEDIPPGVVGFADEIKRGLEGADTFIAVLSPEYLQSTYCVDMELAYAVQLQKKIIPIVLRKFDDYEIPTGIGHINWIYFTPHAGQENTYEESFPKILEVLHTDLEHVKQHKRFLLRAIEWDEGNRHPSFLLNGEEIDNAQGWLAQSAGKEPIPTDLHRDYITTSIKHRQRQQRLLFSGIVVALIISVMLSILSFIGFNDARVAQSTAEANEYIASTARANAETSADLAQTAQADAEANEAISLTAQADAETNEAISLTAQADAEANEAIAKRAQEESERNLQDSRQSQSLFHGDLAQQQADAGLYQRALLLGLESLKFYANGITSDSAYQAIHEALHQPVKQVLHLPFPRGIKDTIHHDTLSQTLIVTDSSDFLACPEIADCSSRVELWDIVTQEQLAYLPHTAPIVTVRWYQDVEQVLTLEGERTANQAVIRLWSTADSSEVYQLPFDKTVLFVWQTGPDTFATIEQDLPFCTSENFADCNRVVNLYDLETGDLITSVSANVNIHDIYMSADGRYLSLLTVTAFFDYVALLYDLNTGELIQSFDELDERVPLVWRDNDTRVIGQSGGDVVSQVLDTGEVQYQISGTSPYVVDGDFIVFTVPDTTRSCDECFEFDVYSSVTGDFLFATDHERNQMEYVGLVQDGTYMLTRTVDSRACVDCPTAYYLWDIETGNLHHTFDYDGWIEGSIGGYALNPNERLILIYSVDIVDRVEIQLWDVATGRKRADIDMDTALVFDVFFDASGQHIVVNQGDVVSLYDARDGQFQHRIGHTQFLNSVTVFRDHLLITTQTTTEFNVWDVVDWSVTLQNPGTIDIFGEAYNEKRDQILTWSGMDEIDDASNNAYVWDTETGQLLFTLETPAPVITGMWSPDERLIVVGLADSIIVFDAKTGKEADRYDSVNGLGFLSWIPDTNHLISDQSDQLIVLDVETGDILFSSSDYIPGLSEWNSDYTHFVDQNTTDFRVDVVSYPDGDVTLTIPFDGVYYSADWVADDTLLVFLIDGTSVRSTDLVAYDVASGEEQYRIENVGIFEASPSAEQILVYTDDRQFHLVNAITGEIQWSVPTLSQEWTDILWSPDESRAILTGFLATQTQLFDVATGDELTTLNFSQYQWSPDSKSILALDDNVEPAVYRVYDVDPDLIRFSFSTNNTIRLFDQFAMPVWTSDSREIVSHDGIWATDFSELINRGEALRVRDLTELELLEFFIKPPPDKPQVDRDRDDDDDDDD